MSVLSTRPANEATVNEDEIPVIKSEQFATYRQHIRPSSQSQLSALLSALIEALRLKRFTGQVVMKINQGGVREIITDQYTAPIAEESAAGKALDSHFGK